METLWRRTRIVEEIAGLAGLEGSWEEEAMCLKRSEKNNSEDRELFRGGRGTGLLKGRLRGENNVFKSMKMYDYVKNIVRV